MPAGWNYLPYQAYANSIFNDTVGKAYVSDAKLSDGLKAWQEASALLTPAGATSELPQEARGTVELAVRRDVGSRCVFLVNHGETAVDLSGTDGEVLVGPAVGGWLVQPPREVVVLRQSAPDGPPGDDFHGRTG